MTFRQVLDFARQWHTWLDAGGDNVAVVFLDKRTGARVVVEGKVCALVLKALVAGATRGCKAIQGVARGPGPRGPYAHFILDDYAAQREAEDAAAAGLAPEQAGVRSVGALGHKTAMSVLGGAAAAAAMHNYLTRPTEPRAAYVPPKRQS